MKTSRKNVPQRTCVACGKITVKQELVRLVRTVDSRVEVDTDGKKAGRGAYLCPVQKCWDNGLKGNRLEHTLRTNLTPDNREQLIKYRENLRQGVS